MADPISNLPSDPQQSADPSGLNGGIPFHTHSGQQGDGPQIDRKNVTGTPVLAKMWLNGAQTLSEHPVPYDKILFDSLLFGNGFTFDSTNHRLVVKVSGYYFITVQLVQQTSADLDLLIARIKISGTEKTYTPMVTGGTANTSAVSSDVFYLNPNDYIEATGYGSKALQNGDANNGCFLIAYKL